MLSSSEMSRFKIKIKVEMWNYENKVSYASFKNSEIQYGTIQVGEYVEGPLKNFWNAPFEANIIRTTDSHCPPFVYKGIQLIMYL